MKGIKKHSNLMGRKGNRAMKCLLFSFCLAGNMQMQGQVLEWYSLWGSSMEGCHIKPTCMAMDSGENIYAAATFSGNGVTVEGQTLSSLQGSDLGDAALIKMTSGKEVEWVYSFAESKQVSISDMVVDKDDNIVVAGTFTGVLNPGGKGRLVFDAGEYEDCTVNAFVMRFSPAGDLLSSWQVPAFELTSLAIDVDEQDNVYVGGTFGSYIKFGEIGEGEFGVDNQFFVAKYSPSGELMWDKISQQDGMAMTNLTLKVDPLTADLYLAGSFTGSLSVDGVSMVSPNTNDMCLLKYNAEGQIQWSKQIGGSDNEKAVDIAISPLGDVALGGTYTSGTMSISGLDSTFVYKYRGEGCEYPHLAVNTFDKETGEFRWQYWYGYANTAEASIQSLRCTDEGVYYISAYTSGRAGDMSTGTVIAGKNSGVQFIDGQHVSHNTNGGADALYLVLSPEGGLCNMARPGGQQTERMNDILLSPDKKHVYMLMELCVRDAIAQIPVDNFFTSFTDINTAGKTGDFNMITVPCPEVVSVGGAYTTAYEGVFYSACLLKTLLPGVTPSELPSYTVGEEYTQSFSMDDCVGTPEFLPLGLPQGFTFESGTLAGVPQDGNGYDITVIASDKTARYDYFTPYSADTQWDETYGGQTTRGNSRNVRNFILKAGNGGTDVVDMKGESQGLLAFENRALRVNLSGKSFSVSVYGVSGAVLLRASNENVVDLGGLLPGVYIAELKAEGMQRQILRFVVR